MSGTLLVITNTGARALKLSDGRSLPPDASLVVEQGVTMQTAAGETTVAYRPATNEDIARLGLPPLSHP